MLTGSGKRGLPDTLFGRSLRLQVASRIRCVVAGTGSFWGGMVKDKTTLVEDGFCFPTLPQACPADDRFLLVLTMVVLTDGLCLFSTLEEASVNWSLPLTFVYF